MGLIKGALDWLRKPTYVEPKPFDIVEVANTASAHEAHQLSQLLENADIKATVYSDNHSNVTAITGLTNGTRVMVLGKDLAAARAIVADFEEDLLTEADPLDEDGEVREEATAIDESHSDTDDFGTASASSETASSEQKVEGKNT